MSPHRFDKEKNVAGLWSDGFSRLFTGQVFIRVFRGSRDCTLETHVGLRRSPGWDGGERVLAGFGKGQNRRRFSLLIPFGDSPGAAAGACMVRDAALLTMRVWDPALRC